MGRLQFYTLIRFLREWKFVYAINAAAYGVYIEQIFSAAAKHE